MASKGKLETEDLKTLSEALPGAMQIGARAIGATSEEMGRMLQRGEILSENFLPKFAAQMSAETASGVAGASKSAQASINRFNNSVYELQTSVGKGILPAQSLGLDVLTGAMDGLQKNARLLLAALLVLTAQGIKLLGGAILQSLGGVLTMKTGIAGLTGAARAALPVLGAFAAQVAIAVAISDTVTIMGKRFNDAGGEFRTFADSLKDGLKQLSDRFDDTGKSAKGFVDSLPKNRSDIKGETYYDGTIIGGLVQGVAGKETGGNILRGAEQAITNPLARRAIGMANPLLRYVLPKETFATKQAPDRQKALDDVFSRGDRRHARR